MRTFSLILALWLGAGFNPAAIAGEAGMRLGYSERLVGLDMQRATRSREAGASMQFDAFGRHLNFRLEENRALRTRVSGSAPDGIDVYRGQIEGEPGSWARFVVVDGQPRGMFFDGSDFYAVEPSADDSAAAAPIVYRLADLEIAPGTLKCSHVGHAKNAMQLLTAVTDDAARPAVQRALGAISNMDVAVVADFEFTDEFGTDTTAELLTRMNIVDEIYTQQLGIQITVSHIDTFPQSEDPFSDETNGNLLLDELSDFRFGSAEHRDAGLTHLFTGRRLDGNNVGIAFSDALCLDRFGAGLTALQRGDFFGGTPVDALIAAHEIGHSFGAPHDGEIGSACESATPLLMATAVNGSDQFSSCSIAEMQDEIEAAQCISVLVATDIEVVPGAVPAVVNIGDNVEVVFEVNNVGTETISNIVLDITLPTTATLDSIDVSAGACTSGAGAASCSIAALASGAGITVTLATTAETAGAATFAAIGSADADLIASNNSATPTFAIQDPTPAPTPTPTPDSDDGGGGILDWLLLIFLGTLATARRRCA